LLAIGFSARANAADRLDLATVKPAISCEQLAKTDLSKVADAPVTIASAALERTPKGTFCRVAGVISPAIHFEVHLPTEHWTQRFLQVGCGGLCGMLHVSISNAGTCQPALDGEFVVSSDDMGHQMIMGEEMGAYGDDPQKRIDFAYRGNHQTTLVTKALIQAFFGQAPRYSYFSGCSDGGREALMEAQRFPDDFDGISAGAPVALFTVQNSFYHAWNFLANRRADGTNILIKSRLNILHDAAVAHCPTLSGVQDGVLEDPRACKFDPPWVQCPAGAADTSKCLTAEETAVASKLYDGPTDTAGAHFIIGGLPMGSEMHWSVPNNATETHGVVSMLEQFLKYIVLPTPQPEGKDLASKFTFTEDTFKQVIEMAPLYNASNTNLAPFLKHGGKLILWHGLADDSVTPSFSVAYYQGVQKLLGEQATDSFLRFFLLPGVGHCGGGEGFAQIDTLTPLMAWTEMHQAPKVLVADKIPDHPPMGPPPPPERQSIGPAMPPPASMGENQKPDPKLIPLPMPNDEPLGHRPVYAYPYVAHYKGSGDVNDPANFEPAKSPVALPQQFKTQAAALIGPDNQKNYRVVDGKLTVDSAAK
jgi:feruloyl esterase